VTPDELRAKLDQAREEARDAARVLFMVGQAATDPRTPPLVAARLDVEVKVAQCRLDLWSDVVVELERRLEDPADRAALRARAAEFDRQAIAAMRGRRR
jgi:hypothetical protein